MICPKESSCPLVEKTVARIFSSTWSFIQAASTGSLMVRIRAIRSTKMGGRELLALLDNIQAGNVTFLTAVNNASEEAETEEAIEKDA